MPAKKTTIATAEKRVIKAEISTLKKALKTIIRDFKQAHRLNDRECAIAVRAAEIARAKHRKQHLRFGKSESRETAAIDKRLAILNGRLNS